MMGREKGRRRLGNPVFKMADQLMAESEIVNLENRPFDQAYLVKKLSSCPHVHCTAQLGGAFFEETGLVQHYRAKQAADRFRYYNEKIERQAWRLFRVKHGKETMQHVEWLSICRRREIC